VHERGHIGVRSKPGVGHRLQSRRDRATVRFGLAKVLEDDEENDRDEKTVVVR
jgi:hypothetical protein